MPQQPSADQSLRAENAELRARLEEAEKMLRAIRAGEVDAPVVEGDAGPRLFTLQGLDAEQNRFRGEMLAQVSDAVVAVDTEERITFLNVAAERQYGVQAGPMLGRKLVEIFTRHWPSPEQEAAVWAALRERGEGHGEYLQRTHQGRELHVDSSIILLRDSQGEIIGRLSAIRDITARRAAEVEVNYREKAHRIAFDQAPTAMVFVGPDGRFIEVNARMCEITGYSAEELVRMNISDLTHPEDRESDAPLVESLLSGGTPQYENEKRYMCKGGIIRWVTVSAHMVNDGAGRPLHTVGVIDDVTARKETETALRLTNERLTLAVKCSEVVLFQQDLELRYIWHRNPELGLKVSDFIGKRDADLMERAEDAAVTEGLKREVIRTGVGQRREVLVHIQGVDRHYDLLVEPQRDAAGLITGITGAAIDITERKRAEESRRLLASIVENSRDFIGIADTHGDPIYGNRAAMELVGVQDLEQVRRSKIIDYFIPEQRPFVEGVVLPAVATDGRWSGELTMQHFVTGAKIPVWYDLFRVDDPATGQPANFATITRNLTESKQAEEALREKAHFLQRIAEITPGVLHVYDLVERRAVFINRSVTSLLGYSPEEVLAMGANATPSLMHPEDLPRFDEHMARLCALADGEVAQFEFRMRDRAGAWHWFLNHDSIFSRDATGAARQTIGVASEITDRKHAEEALRESEGRLQMAISVQSVGVLFFKPGGHILDANGALERMSGYTAEEMRRITDWAQLTPPEFMDVTRRAAAELAERGVTAPYEKQWICKDGTRFWGLFSPTRLSGSGSESECVKFIVDITETKRAEEQLRLHRELLETVVNYLPAAVALIRGSDLTLQMVNPGYQAISPGKQMVGKTISEVWPETNPLFGQRCRHVLETGEPFNAVDERYEICRDSDAPLETTYFSWSMHKVNLPDEVQPGLILTIWETTARKEVELALCEKNERYKALFDSIDQGFCIIEVRFEENRPEDYLFLEVNPAFEKHTGIKDAQGKWMRELVPDHEEHWFAIFGKIALTGEPARFEKHGQALGRWFDVCAFRVGEPEEHRVAILFTDITERRKAHEAVARLAAIVECSYDALLSEDLDGIVTSWNRGAEQIFGYCADEIIGTSIMRFIPEVGHAAEHELQRQIVTGKRGGTFEATRQAKDGREFHASITVSPMTDAAGKIIGTSRVIRDITGRKRAAESLRAAKEAAEAANAAKDRFLAALSHELRTPLTPVLLVSEVHAKSNKLSENLREDFEMIHRNIVLEAQLIDDLLDVSRIQQGKMRFAFKPVDVHEAIARSLEMLRSEVEEKGIAVQLELGVTPATLEADPGRLRQVLCNLLRNAVKFTPRGGTITVHTARDQSVLQISIADTGAGIVTEDLERIFQPFEQVDAQQESEHRSLGLGLAISKAIIAAHRGRIWAESPGPGQGSTLHVQLPF
ncbi:MAG: PAS domain S-box protein [Undibacterium sp.]|nr:PAS domain S-box protein [Opitutaceae bacterium]